MNKPKEDPILTEIQTKYKGRITTFVIPLDEDEDEETENRKVATIYLKNADKTTRNMIAKLSRGSVPEKAVIAGLKSLRLGGDEVSVLENNDYALLSAESALVKHLEVQATIIKKN